MRAGFLIILLPRQAALCQPLPALFTDVPAQQFTLQPVEQGHQFRREGDAPVLLQFFREAAACGFLQFLCRGFNAQQWGEAAREVDRLDAGGVRLRGGEAQPYQTRVNRSGPPSWGVSRTVLPVRRPSGSYR
ncbi:hypothetical protein PUATCC27989T_04305 [Phytobacter ursingii]|nr:hypothetical protein PUATCC27989T_04305 [Phytobacter ursingii]